MEVGVDTGGYDAEFVDELPDYFKCIICHLALKQPVLFVDCGHRVCASCFRQMKEFAQQTSTNLLCPHDRTLIDANKVFEDKGIMRPILDFKVRCGHTGEGCTWVGELRDLQSHLDSDCSYVIIDTKKVLRDLVRKVDSCEKKLSTKDEEVRYLEAALATSQEKIAELEEKFKKENTVGATGAVNTEEPLDREISTSLCLEDDIASNYMLIVKLMKEVSELKKERDVGAAGSIINETTSQVEFEDLKQSSTLHQKQIVNLQQQVREMQKEKIIGAACGISTESISQVEVDDLKKRSILHQKQIQNLQKEVSKLKKEKGSEGSENAAAENVPSQTKEEIENLKKGATSSQSQIKTLQQQFRELMKNTSVQNKPVENESMDTSEKKGGKGGDKGPRYVKNNKDIESASIVKRFMNVEEYIPGGQTLFVWKINNYAKVTEDEVELYSPKFYSRFTLGHCCMLRLELFGKKKGRGGVYLHICKGLYGEVSQYKFNMAFEIKSVDAKGEETKFVASQNEVMKNQRLFDVHENEDEDDDDCSSEDEDDRSIGFGTDTFSNAIKTHVVNDTLTICCTLIEI